MPDGDRDVPRADRAAARGTGMPSIRDHVTDAITYHPGNRTGTPEQRRPACEAIANIALQTIAAHLRVLLDTEEPSDDHAGVQRVIELLEER